MEIEKKLETIKNYNRNADFIHAKQLLSSLLSNVENKNNIELIIELGQMYAGINNYEKSKKCFLRVLKTNKDNLYALFGICRCYIALNSLTAVKKTMKSIMQTLKEKSKKEEYNITIDSFFKDIIYNKILNEKYKNADDKNSWLRFIINNINEISMKEKISLIKDFSLFYRGKREFKKEEKLFASIIAKDNSVIEINEMFIDLLNSQGKYKEAYKKIKTLKLKNKNKTVNYIVNNLINIEMNSEKEIENMDIDSMLSFYFKLKKIKYLQNDSYFIQKLNSLVFQILVLIRQQNYKVREEIYIKMLRQTGKKYFNIRNSMLNEIEWNKKELILKSKPRVVQAMLTNKCNSKCKMCSINKDHKWELTNTGFKNISEILKYADSVTWQGGEVQFCKQFTELVQIARKYNVSQHIITNGINWDENLLKEVMHGDMNIAVSVDGFDADTYEYIRGVNGFDKMQEFMSMFNKHRTNQNRLKMYTTVMNINVSQLLNIPDFVNKNKIDEVVVSPLKKLVDNDFFYKENMFFEKDGSTLLKYNEKIKKVNEVVDKLSNELSMTKTKFVSYLPKICDNKTLNNRSSDGLVCNESCSETENIFCPAPWKHISIIEKGLVVPTYSCGQSLVFGNINSDNILKKWNSEQMQNIRKDIVNSCAEKWCGRCKSLSC